MTSTAVILSKIDLRSYTTTRPITKNRKGCGAICTASSVFFARCAVLGAALKHIPIKILVLSTGWQTITGHIVYIGGGTNAYI